MSLTASPLCRLIADQLGRLFECSPMRGGDRVRVSTPFSYPDGGLIDLFAINTPAGLELTDLGLTLHMLRMDYLRMDRTAKQDRELEAICKLHGVRHDQGHLSVFVEAESQLADSLIRLVQATIRASDLYRLAPQPTTQEDDFVESVAEFLQSQQFRHTPDVPLTGASGATHTVPFLVFGKVRDCGLFLLPDRGSEQDAIEHAVAAIVDLRNAASRNTPLDGPTPEYVSVVDDRAREWKVERIRQVEAQSQVIQWSQPGTLRRAIAAVTGL